MPGERVGYPWAGSSVAEHGTFNPLVEGSNPSRLTKILRSELGSRLADRGCVPGITARLGGPLPGLVFMSAGVHW